MVGKYQGNAARMDVMGGAEGLHGHGRALNMPSRSDIPPFCLEKDPVFKFIQGGPFKKSKILRVFFFVLIQINSLAEPDLVEVYSREFSVVLKSREVKIDGT